MIEFIEYTFIHLDLFCKKLKSRFKDFLLSRNCITRQFIPKPIHSNYHYPQWLALSLCTIPWVCSSTIHQSSVVLWSALFLETGWSLLSVLKGTISRWLHSKADVLTYGTTSISIWLRCGEIPCTKYKMRQTVYRKGWCIFAPLCSLTTGC